MMNNNCTTKDVNAENSPYRAIFVNEYSGFVVDWRKGGHMGKNYNVAQIIAANNEDEQEAIVGYLKLLEVLEDPEDIAQIEEIMGDEKEHSSRLSEMQLKYDGGVPEAKD